MFHRNLAGAGKLQRRGLGPVPPRWEGVCQEGMRFNASNCNKTIIGARFFLNGITAVHESGQALQSPAERGSELLSLRGTLMTTGLTRPPLRPAFRAQRGLRRTWPRLGERRSSPCSLGHLQGLPDGVKEPAAPHDMFAAFDSAISDGVDIISVSVGINQPPHPDYLEARNNISIGAFHAVARGITIVSSAGNSGPSPQKVGNTAPWIITLAASTVDRSFLTVVTLGNNRSPLAGF
ncbi:Subtilisin-like protease SBT3-8 [Nymphaea thermarum]|nr:Subtilisin-like protease SBT3-8 [Nymphaea thermarum]